ncbi:MAG: nuclear transport factor 2 family protein [Deltaproteobacteria bacterium]|nr:nuclear transport factor 2 family protein [Deltaproteobacteria bacterium]MBW2445493.1 nuclear transport factor 2 family protein [Deltaproteobacteria bacterium]
MAGEAEIEIARKLFAAWSSGDPDAPREFLTEDAVLHDIVAGSDKVGWPEIREFFAFALSVSPDLVLAPDAFWLNDTGVALRFHMSATVKGDMFGPDARGKKWHSDGMSTLEFRDGKVCREVDYHHGGAVARSLGIGG